MRLIEAILVVALSAAAKGSQELGGHALFVRTPDADSGKKIARGLSLRESLYELPLAKENENERERERKERRYNLSKMVI